MRTSRGQKARARHHGALVGRARTDGAGVPFRALDVVVTLQRRSQRVDETIERPSINDINA